MASEFKNASVKIRTAKIKQKKRKRSPRDDQKLFAKIKVCT